MKAHNSSNSHISEHHAHDQRKSSRAIEPLERRFMLAVDPGWTVSNSITDHSGTSAYSSNPAIVAEVPPIQSYQGDLYENWSSSVQDAAQTDIVQYQLGSDAEFIYFRFVMRGSVSGNESTVYHIEVEADSDDTGGDARSDYFIAYNPSNNDVSASWRSAGLTDIKVHRDANNSVGGSNLAAPDSGDTDGYEADVSFNATTDVYARLVDVPAGAPVFNVVDVAVRRTVLGQSTTSTISSRGTSKQDGNIDKSKLFFHDRNTSSDLTSNRIDNTRFLALQAPQPGFTIAKSGDQYGKATDDAAYTVTITNTGAVALYPQSIVDSLAGTLSAADFTESGTNNNILDIGEIWTLDYSRTVLISDPDPLLNTVTAVFDTASDLSGQEVTEDDDHTVDLFAPAVQITKTADKLAAVVGDTVTYTFTITNLSDGDLTTADLDGTAPVLQLSSITDTALGDLSSYAAAENLDVLSLNESGSFEVQHIVLASDPVPLINTAQVLYHPDGFANEITDDDSHTLYIVDANLVLGPGEATNGIGETHTFTATAAVTGGVLASGGATVDAEIDSGPGVLSGVPGLTSGAGTASGFREFTLVSDTTGTTVVSASASIPIDVNGDGTADITLNRSTNDSTTAGGLANSPPAEKTWIDGDVRWLKHNGFGQLLGGATFELRRTHDRFGSNIIPDDPILTVADNGVHDIDPTPGEIQVANLPLGRYEIKEIAPPAGFSSDPDTEIVQLTLSNPSNADNTQGDLVPIFVNSPILQAPSFGHTPGYWRNVNGNAKLNDNGSAKPELDMLCALNLKNKNGTDFNPKTIDELNNWLKGASATNMAYMLSVHLACMTLNVEAGFVAGTATVYAPQLLTFAPMTGLTATGTISIDNLTAAANLALGIDGNTPAGDANRPRQEALKIALDDANNSLNFVVI